MTETGAFQIASIRGQDLTTGKHSQLIAKSDILMATVQTVSPSGGETNLHSHAGNDALWVVTQGEATFYTVGDEVVTTLKPNDTLLIPRNTPYWFKSSGTQNLVILRVGAAAQGIEEKRTDYTPRIRREPAAAAS